MSTTNLASLKIEREKAAQLFSMPQTLILFAEAIGMFMA